VRFFVGDVRERERLTRSLEWAHLCFHLAALKHVESCEYNPFEAIKTNILGTQNVIDVALDHQIERVVFSSTDKAVNPANAMGASKLMAEKLMVAANYYKGPRATVFASVRFGNVLASSGSVAPTFVERIKLGLPIELTHPEMTRFVITLDESVDLLLAGLDLCRGGEILIRKMPIVRLIDLAEALLEMHGLPADERHMRVVGPRAGEKMYEELVTLEESTRTFDVGAYYVIKPQISHKPHAPGGGQPIPVRAYTSESAAPLSKREVRDLLRRALPDASFGGAA
jgi:FlaA1/EpsC-like NDP-sugar epimerase